MSDAIISPSGVLLPEPNKILRAVEDRAFLAIALYLEQKTYAQMRARLWEAVKRLFYGGDIGNFLATFARVIDQQLTEAWNSGAAEIGVLPEEMTNDDINILKAIIFNEFPFIQRLGMDIANSRAQGMKDADFESYYGARTDLWANRYTETLNRARMHFGSRTRLEWVEGGTFDKCEICLGLNGVVAFGYEWEIARFHPQMPPNPLLVCHGWKCQCQLVPTNKRRTRLAISFLLDFALHAVAAAAAS